MVVGAALSLLGVIFVVLMVLAGYNWMTASGNEQKVDEAKSTLKRAIIGLVIVLGAWSIWRFILENLIDRL
jgi:ABC-type nickel/cobalt efflux system permease component RcnA